MCGCKKIFFLEKLSTFNVRKFFFLEKLSTFNLLDQPMYYKYQNVSTLFTIKNNYELSINNDDPL